MRKTFFILVLFVAIFFSNMTSIYANTKANAKLIKKSIAFTEDFRKNNFTDFYKNISTNNSISNSLKNDIAIAIKESGLFMKLSASYAEKNGDCKNIIINDEYKNKDISMTFTYNEKGKVEDFTFKVLEKRNDDPIKTYSSFNEYPMILGHGDNKLKGILTLPINKDRPAVVIFVPDLGAMDMNYTIGTANNKPFQDLAHGLAEKGISSIRFDKRSFTYNTNNDINTIENDILNDVFSVIETMKNDFRIDRSNIYILGHGLGGTVSPYIATNSPSIQGIIIMAGSLRPLEDRFLSQYKNYLNKANNIPIKTKEEIFGILTEKNKKVKNFLSGHHTPEETFFSLHKNFWKSLANLKNDTLIENLSIPLLILQGGKDFQTSPNLDFELYQTILSNKKNVTYQLYDNLNYYFMPTQNTLISLTTYDQPNKVDSKVIDDIAIWLNSIKK